MNAARACAQDIQLQSCVADCKPSDRITKGSYLPTTTPGGPLSCQVSSHFPQPHPELIVQVRGQQLQQQQSTMLTRLCNSCCRRLMVRYAMLAAMRTGVQVHVPLHNMLQGSCHLNSDGCGYAWNGMAMCRTQNIPEGFPALAGAQSVQQAVALPDPGSAALPPT